MIHKAGSLTKKAPVKGDPISVRLNNPGDKKILKEIADQLELKYSVLVAFLVSDVIALYKREGINGVRNKELDI